MLQDKAKDNILNELDDKNKVKYIVELLLNQFPITEISFIVPIIYIFLINLKDVKLTFSLVWDILDNPSM